MRIFVANLKLFVDKLLENEINLNFVEPEVVVNSRRQRQ